jgi:hypothetical protein
MIPAADRAVYGGLRKSVLAGDREETGWAQR